MDKDLARLVVRSMIKSSSELTSLVPVLKQYCDAEEYEYFGKTLARTGEAGTAIIFYPLFLECRLCFSPITMLNPLQGCAYPL